MKADIAVENNLLKKKIEMLLDNMEVNVLRSLIMPRKNDNAITAIKATIGF